MHTTSVAKRLASICVAAMVGITAVVLAGPPGGEFRGQLGDQNAKIKKEAGMTAVWAGENPTQPGESKWFDFSGSSVPPGQLQFGIGMDRIRSIDDPTFVKPDDKRLADLPDSPYRKGETAATINDLRVIGVVRGREARAYPLGLLDFHEVVNDQFGSDSVTVAWAPIAELSIVFAREGSGRAHTFGQSGYSFRNKFLLFDRATQSLWQPLPNQTLRAVAGQRRGDTIAIAESPPIMTLGEWRVRHPDTVVLLGSDADIRREESRRSP